MSHKIHPATAAGIIVPALCIALLLSVSCKRQEKGRLIQANPAFREYVEAFTSGLVSTHATVRIRMNEDFVDSSSVGVPLTNELITLDPSVKGVLMWTDGRTLEFKPDEPFAQDKLFTVNFHIIKLFTVPDSLRTMTFQFRTIKQDFDLSIDHHYAENGSDLTKEIISGTLYTADVAKDSAVELMLSARQDGNGLQVTWQHDGKNNRHVFQVQGIARGNSPSAVKLNFKGDPIGAGIDKDLKEDVAALDDFKYTGIRNMAGGDPCFILTFTDPLKEHQLLEALVHGNKHTTIRVNSDQNELYVYPPAETEKEFTLTVEPYLRNSKEKELGRKIVLKLNPAENKPGAIYSVNLAYKKEYSAYPCDSSGSVQRLDMIVTRTIAEKEGNNNWNYYSEYDSDEDEGGGWQSYHWQERDDPCKASYYFNKSETRNVFASNLGIVAKGGSENEFTVFVTDLISAKPLNMWLLYGWAMLRGKAAQVSQG